MYCRIKGFAYINVYNSNALNLKAFEERRALPIFTRGISCGVKYWHELGQDLDVGCLLKHFHFNQCQNLSCM